MSVQQQTNEKDLGGIHPAIYARRWPILGSLCLALLGVMLANTSMSLALPRIAVDLGIDQLGLTWIVNIYTLLFASFLFIASAIGDRYGRKIALQVGMAVFIVSALYAAFIAGTSAELIVARAVMGLGGAFIMPTTLSIIDNVFPRRERARAIAIWSAVAGVGMLFGSIVSGILLEHFSWHSLFYLSAGVGAIGLVMNAFLVPETKDEQHHPVDWLGGFFSAVGIFGVVYGITEAPSAGLADSWVLLGLIGGLVSLVLFVWWELRNPSPLLDMQLFKNRAFSVSALALILTFLAMMGVFFSLSQLQQLILGFTPLESALRMIPIMLPMMVVSPMVPSIVKKFGARLTMAAGLFIVSAAFLIMRQWTADMTYWHMLGTMLVMMAGISLTMTPGTNILMASVPRNRAGMGSAMNDTTRELGGALGVAVLGAILSAAYERNIAATASQFAEPVKTVITSSLAGAMNVLGQMGPQFAGVLHDARVAWMDALALSSTVAAGIVFVAAVIALVALPKHVQSKENSDTI